MDESEVRKAVKHAVAKAGGVRALAREWELSAAYLSDFVNGRRGPGKTICERLGVHKVVVTKYIKGAEWEG